MKLLKLIVLTIAFGGINIAYAGYTQPYPVEIDLDAKTAQGDMSATRWSKDKDALIGCGVRSIDAGGGSVFTWWFCQAGNSDVGSINCVSTNMDLMKGVDVISDGSFITFSWDDNFECTAVGTSTQSFYINKDNPSFVNKIKNTTP